MQDNSSNLSLDLDEEAKNRLKRGLRENTPRGRTISSQDLEVGRSSDNKDSSSDHSPKCLSGAMKKNQDLFEKFIDFEIINSIVENTLNRSSDGPEELVCTGHVSA